MKLIKFSGINIRGYLNPKIEFYKDLNFLIGTNGSGKTTVLNLIKGLLTPSYEILTEIEYEEIKLSVENNEKKEVIISSQKNGDKVSLSYKEENAEPQEYTFNSLSKDIFQLNVFSNENFFENNQVVNKIKEMKGYLYLGIDRQFDYKKTNNYLDRFSKHGLKNVEATSNLDSSLNHAKKILSYAIGKSNALQARISESFKTEILRESFTFVDDVSFGDESELEPFLQQIEKQEKELNSIIETYKMKDLTENCNKFFNDLRNVVNELMVWRNNPEREKSDDFFKLILLFGVNKSMLKKINRIVELGKRNMAAILKVQEGIAKFVNIENEFLRETNKKISVNSSGELIVSFQKGRKGTLFDLSSGEKQLIIIFTYLIFNGDTSSVFVIDEPELSLHIAWQEIFVDAVQKANPNAQLIFATHAPSIIAKKSRQSNCIDLSEK